VPDAPLRLRVTNTGTQAIATGSELVAAWEASAGPYLASPPDGLRAVGEPLPALEPGESVVVEVLLPEPPSDVRALAWISLLEGGTAFSELGSPPLQLASEAP
jgi:hypothetical protein